MEAFSSFDIAMMKHALVLAREAIELGEVPVGAVVTRGEKIVSQAYNLREALNDPTAHAERLAITLAGQALGTWRLEGCTVYVTLEPCTMCAGAIVLGRVERLIYGAHDPKAGACHSLYQITSDARLNHRTRVISGLLNEDCGAILRDFFLGRRRSSAAPGLIGRGA
jgi:tRNA(adenine34) deaminase